MNLGILMSMEIYKAWSDYEARRIDDLGTLSVIYLANFGDATAANGNVAAEARQSSAVDDSPILNNGIVLTHDALPVCAVEMGAN